MVTAETRDYGLPESVVAAGLLVLLCMVVIPHPVLAQCTDDPIHNYSLCLDQVHDPAIKRDISTCACCIVTYPGGNLLEQCGGAKWNSGSPFPSCDKPIGILINATSAHLTDDLSHPIQYTDPTNSQCNCCNVGILSKKEPGGGVLNDVVIDGVKVQGWATGILFGMATRAGNGVIHNSVLADNTIGVYLFNSGGNTISSNTFSSNENGILLESKDCHKCTENNLIFNNYFNDDSKNVDFIDPQYNKWNITSLQPGINILGWYGGNYLGGNYWGKPDNSGPSDTCECNLNGICTSSVTLDSIGPNIDYFPLCKPTIFDVSPSSISGWTLSPGDNYVQPAFTVILHSNQVTRITLTTTPSDGKMVSSSGPLANWLMMGHKYPDDWQRVTTWYISEKNFEDTFDLKQNVVLGTDKPGEYHISLTFTMTEL